MICVKADEAPAWRQLCAEEGRAGDLEEFGVGKNTCNFISYEAAGYDQVPIENLVSLLTEAAGVMARKGDEDFWVRAAKQLLRSLLTIVYCHAGRITIQDLYLCLANLPWRRFQNEEEEQEWMQKPLGFMIANPSVSHPDLTASVSYVLDEWAKRDPRSNSGIALTMSEMVDVLRRDPLQRLLCGETTITPDACRQGKIILLDIPVLTMGEVGKMAQIIFKLIAQRGFNRNTDGRPTFIWADECHHVASPQDMGFLSTARSHRVVSVYLTQNLPLWITEAGGGPASEDRVKATIGNLATKVFCCNSDPKTNTFASDVIGKSLQRRKSTSAQQGFNRGRASTGRSTSYSEIVDHDCPPGEFQRLWQGGSRYGFMCSAVIFKTGRRWANGKRFFTATFDQRQRLTVHWTAWLLAWTGAAVAAGALALWAVHAGFLRLPHQVPRWVWFNPRLREVYLFLGRYGDHLFPLTVTLMVALTVATIFRKVGVLRCARWD